MTVRVFTPTLFPLVNVVTEKDNYGHDRTVGYVTSEWRRFQEGVAIVGAPGGSGEVLTSNGVSQVWQKIVNANVAGSAAIAWTKISKTGSSLADLDTRNAADLASGQVALARGGTNANLSATGGTSQVLRQSSAGAAVTVSQLASTDISGIVASTYTPTLTGVANVAASTAYQCVYTRVGVNVTVSGKVDVDPTAGATLTQLGISLPVASNIGAEEDCCGSACAPVVSYPGAILGDAANNRAELQFTTAADVANRSWYFQFHYRII